jgi:hypothetical protein
LRRSDTRRCWRAIRVALVRPFRPGRRHPVVLLAGLLLILGWQAPYLQYPERVAARYQATASHGIDHEDRFVYFLYYLGLYPVALRSLWPPKDYSEAGANRMLVFTPKQLVQDIRFTFYSGERGKTLLYLFDAWLKGEPKNPSLKPSNRLVWMLALLGLWTSFWWLRRPIVGGLFVVLFGSNPFALYAVNAEENVHAWPVLSAALALALTLPYFATAPPRRWRMWILPLATGIVLGSICTLRTEPVLMILAPLLVYLTARALCWRQRLGLVVVLMASFAVTLRAWNAWFDAKDRQAAALLEALGGHPYPGEHLAGHQVWHPIWCGLGDFDTKYGYKWLDDAALKYAQPILKRRFGIVVGYPWHKYGAYLDAARQYPLFYSELPEYTEIIRDKVLHDIVHDPRWYLGILGKRAWRLLDETSPVRVSAAFRHVPIPLHGLVLFPLAALLWRARSRFALRLLLFTLPTCITPFLIYSGDGMSYYAVYPIAAAAILGAVGVDQLGPVLGRAWRRARSAARWPDFSRQPAPYPVAPPPSMLPLAPKTARRHRRRRRRGHRR